MRLATLTERESNLPTHTTIKPKRAGYAYTQNVKATLSLVRENKLVEGQKVDAATLGKLGISKGDTVPVMGTLRSFQWVDEDNCVTERFVQLAHASGDEYQHLLRKALEDTYSVIFSQANVSQAKPKELMAIFEREHYEPKQHRKMTSLFIGLCHESGLLSNNSTVFDSANEQESPIHLSDEATVGNLPASTLVEHTPMHEPIEAANLNGLSYEYPHFPQIVGQVEVLQRLLEIPRSASEYAWWQETFRMNATMLLKLLEKGEEK